MPVVGYFTAEIGLWSELHTYSGGLGVLAGDHVKSAADAGIPLVGVTLLYHQGYARQHIDSNGIQTETFPEFDPNKHLTKTDMTITLTLDENTVRLMYGRPTSSVNQDTLFLCISSTRVMKQILQNIKVSPQDSMEETMTCGFVKNMSSALVASSCLITLMSKWKACI